MSWTEIIKRPEFISLKFGLLDDPKLLRLELLMWMRERWNVNLGETKHLKGVGPKEWSMTFQ